MSTHQPAEERSSVESTIRSLKNSAAAHRRWSRVADRNLETAPARQAFLDKFDDEVDPERKLAPEVRAKMAANARSSYFRLLRARGLEKPKEAS